MAKVSFKVSARTARLIGRENIASSKGAVIELVKNASDADSKTCIIYIDNKYNYLPETLDLSEAEDLIKRGIDQNQINSVYTKCVNRYTITQSDDIHKRELLLSNLKDLNSLYIIDQGEGMTKQVILDHWMTIGTANKAYDIITSSGRVKAGAKGIGRFALDKLGDTCQMVTKFDATEITKRNEKDIAAGIAGYKWEIDWSDFDNDLSTIDAVKAELIELKEVDISEQVKNISNNTAFNETLSGFDFSKGTILKIGRLRDDWDNVLINQVYSDLEVLVPPEEFGIFSIFLYSHSQSNSQGKITSSTCDDYDYKVSAVSISDQKLKITVFRNELNVSAVDPAFFSREEMQAYPYTKKDFENGRWTIERTLSQLLPGFKIDDKEDVLSRIGAFEFHFYYMKRNFSSPDASKFFYKSFNVAERKLWLNKYGGIKVFRDNFRVRPYGEINNTSFDWLALGSRKSKSPAAPSRVEGGYRVEPDNVSGVVKISRAKNSIFEDKSSREGMLDSTAFYVLQRILVSIIRLFEDDRAYVARALEQYDQNKNFDSIAQKEAERLAKSLLSKKSENDRKGKEGKNSLFPEISNTANSQLIVLAELNSRKDQKIERLQDEQKILRGLASSGIVIASFTHELSNLNQVLGQRIDELQELLHEKISNSDYKLVEDFLNPFVLMDRMRSQDLKMQSWLKFSLNAARKDKRKIKEISLTNYFIRLQETWNSALINRQVSFTSVNRRTDEPELRIYEIDLDSIFNNLIVNSVDAFLRNDKPIKRTINIEVGGDQNHLDIKYSDNGPGLSEDITPPESIFEALFTTKRNLQTGEEEGTGIGMWLVKSIVEDNDGVAKLYFPETGFGLLVTFPLKKEAKQ